MPFRNLVREGVLISDDLDFLQDVYESATEGLTVVDDVTMHNVVETLIMYYRAGERDPEKLIAMAAYDMRRAIG